MTIQPSNRWRRILRGPQPWLWFAAVCIVASLSALWTRPLRVNDPVNVAGPAGQRSKPVLATTPPVQDTTLFPVKPASQLHRPATVPRLQPARYRQPPASETAQTEVVQADWQSDDESQPAPVQRVSVNYVVADEPDAVWFTGAIEPEGATVPPTAARPEHPPARQTPAADPASRAPDLPIIVPAEIPSRR